MVPEEDKGSDKFQFSERIQAMCYRNRRLHENLCESSEMLSEPIRSPQAEREVSRDTSVRRARTCYDHLAGVAGALLYAELSKRGWITEEDGKKHPAITLTPVGKTTLESCGVNVRGSYESKRKFAYGCLDWTERVHHLGGALGANILIALQSAKIVARNGDDRSVIVSGSLVEWLDASSS